MTRVGRVGLHLGWLGFALALTLAFALDDAALGLSRPEVIVAGVTWIMACWWMTEAAPLAATSMIPLVAFPLLGIMSAAQVAPTYFSSFIVLLMAGFMLAQAVERWGLHRRLALAVLRRVGTAPTSLLAGFMGISALLSMWISNTATVLMMLPIATAVSDQLRGVPRLGQSAPPPNGFDAALLLGVAYAGSIGGIGTPIGTPPNVIFLSQFDALPGLTPPSFGAWMAMALPLVVVLLALTWAWLARSARRHAPPADPAASRQVADELEATRRALGPLRPAERRVAVVFALTAAAWITRADLAFGPLILPGWQRLLGSAAPLIDDSTVAVLAVLALFVLPADPRSARPAPDADADAPPPHRRLLDWETAKQIPWGLLLLFGGGLALSAGFRASGLSAYIGEALAQLGVLPPVLVAIAVGLAVTFLTEVTSNTATASVLLPILAAASLRSGLDPLLLMVPATLAASCAFMLPVATAPNAIVFGTGRVPIAQMARTGMLLNLVSAVIIGLWVHLAGASLLRP